MQGKLSGFVKRIFNKISFFCFNIKSSRFAIRTKKIFPHISIELACVVLILSLIGSSYFISNSNRFLNNESSTPSSADKSDFDVYKNNDVDKYVIEYNESQYCFFGDSRFVGMNKAVSTTATFIAEGAKGLTWFNNTAVNRYEERKNDFEVIIVALGVNDLNNCDNYIKSLNTFGENNKNKLLFYVNIGPVNESKFKRITNQQITDFNSKIAAGLNDNWRVLDQYSFLQQKGFNSSDGIHYDAQTSDKIFHWILQSTNKQFLKNKE